MLFNDVCFDDVAPASGFKNYWVGPDNNSPPGMFILDFGVRIILKKVKLQNSPNHSRDHGTNGFM